MRGRIDIVLPGLFDLPLGEFEPSLVSERLPALNRILRLATPRPNRAFSIDATLRRVLRLDTESGDGLPLAQAWASGQGTRAERLILFRAVHLRADLQSAVLIPVGESRRDQTDIEILINDLSDLFNVDCDINALTGGLYLMQLKSLDAPTHYPHILSVLGKTVNPYIEQSRGDLAWYRLVNEMQMFLHQHDINRERAGRDLPAINSLWFWGGGLPPSPGSAVLAWYCDDALLNRFAESLGLRPAALERIAASPPAANAAVVDLRLLEALKSGVPGELEALLQDIDSRLLRPLLAGPRGGRGPLLLRAGYEYDFYLPPAAHWKFWRRPRSLADWAAAEMHL